MTTSRVFQSKSAVLAAVIAALIFAGTTLATAQTESVLHFFQSSNKSDGANPNGGLVADGKGALYGVTSFGGTNWSCGSAYKLSPPASPGGVWKQNILYNFTCNADGGSPNGTLLIDARNQKLYGVAENGLGYGVVYEMTPGNPWTETVVYTFTGYNDGRTPRGGLIADSRGILYGTTVGGGTHERNFGVVYRLEPPATSGGAWRQNTIYSFNGGSSDGGYPYAKMVMDSSGALYGTTTSGGLLAANCPPSGCGTVFRLVPPPSGTGAWTESILHFFTGGGDGAYPIGGLVIDKNGALYGTTNGGGVGGGQCGCGTVFQLIPPSTEGGAWTENTLYTFTDGADGADPAASLIFDSAGSLYGTTEYGGDTALLCGNDLLPGCGTVFKLSPPSTAGGAWTESVLHAFQGSDGAYLNGPVLLRGATFYGTTYWGGESQPPGTGTVFEITP
jgi:uncharacterized repeat protein (TIGR03803 family)